MSHKFWLNLIKNDLFFKQSKDCLNFKLENTQCQFSLTEYQKNGQEAQEIVDKLKQMIIDRPIETIAKELPESKINSVYYLNKSEILEKFGISPKRIWVNTIEESTKSFDLWSLVKENQSNIMLPISLSFVFGFMYYFKYHRA